MITMYFVYKGSQKESLESIVEIQYEQDKSKPYRAMMENSSLTKEKLKGDEAEPHFNIFFAVGSVKLQ